MSEGHQSDTGESEKTAIGPKKDVVGPGLKSDELRTCVAEAQRCVANLENQECFLVLGNTGTGKSTVITYLQGATLEREFDENTGDKFLKTKHPQERGTPRISGPSNRFKSETKYPQLFHVLANQGFDGLQFCDTPGFQDTGTKEERIARAVSTHLALTQLRIKGILVVFSKDEICGVRGDGIKEILKVLRLLLKQPSALIRNLVFCFNKFEPERKVRHLRKILLKLVESLQREKDRKFAAVIAQSNSLFLVHPCDGGASRKEINAALMKMQTQTQMPKSCFRFTADQRTLRELGEWVRDTTRICVATYRELRHLKKAMQDEKQVIVACKQAIAKGGAKMEDENKEEEEDEKALEGHQQTLEDRRNELFDEIDGLAEDTTLIAWRKKVRKVQEVQHREVNLLKLAVAVGTGTAMAVVGPEILATGLVTLSVGKVVGAVGKFKDVFTKIKTKYVLHEEIEDISCDADGQPTEQPPEKTIIYIAKNKHPVINAKISAHVAELRQLNAQLEKVKAQLQLIRLKERHAHRAAQYEIALSTLACHRPRIATVHKISQMICLDDGKVFGDHVSHFFAIWHENCFQLN